VEATGAANSADKVVDSVEATGAANSADKVAVVRARVVETSHALNLKR
jgi:hypothetical protein